MGTLKVGNNFLKFGDEMGGGGIARIATPIIPTNNLLTYYTFDNNFDDQSGNGYHLSVQSSGTPIPLAYETDRHGNENGCIRFTNSLAIGSFFLFRQIIPVDEYTVSLWTNKERNVPNNDVVFQLRFGSERFSIYNNFANPLGSATYLNEIIGTQEEMVNGIWQHHVFIVKRTTGEFKYYRDAKLIVNVIKNPIAVNLIELSVGYGTGGAPYDGRVDDMRIYTSRLDINDVWALYLE
jgi:hypothetical protein